MDRYPKLDMMDLFIAYIMLFSVQGSKTAPWLSEIHGMSLQCVFGIFLLFERESSLDFTSYNLNASRSTVGSIMCFVVAA